VRGKRLGSVGEIRSPKAEPLFTRQSVFCALLLAACVLAVWPVVEIGINDDWSYVLTTRIFAETGHFVYNGWATTILGWQVIWGALFARVFGSSFTALRMSVVPIDLATALLYHAILRRFGLNKSHATLGTLTLVLSPLFLPLGTTFMSDVPGFFPLVLCVYLCQLAVDASSDNAARAWLITAALTNIALGTVRQTAWLGVLVVVPCCGWLLRRRRYVVPLTIGLWVLGHLCVRVTLHWFLRQPYAVPYFVLGGHADLLALERLLRNGLYLALTAILLCLPALATGLSTVFPLRRRAMLRGGVLLLLFIALVAVFHHQGRTLALAPPWLGTTIDYSGLWNCFNLLSSRSDPAVGMLLFLLCCLACLWAFLETLNRGPIDKKVQSAHVRWRTASILLLPLLLCYAVLLIPGSAFARVFDRYLLVIVPVVLFYILGWHQERVSARVPAIAVLVLIVFAWVGVASTHDLFAKERARLQLLDELQRAGVPRTAIRGQFAFDAMTQIDAWGYVNEPAIVNPAGAYHPRPEETGPCAYWFSRYVPVIQALYEVETQPNPCVGASQFAPVPYRAWLPPGKMYVWAGSLPGSGGR